MSIVFLFVFSILVVFAYVCLTVYRRTSHYNLIVSYSKWDKHVRHTSTHKIPMTMFRKGRESLGELHPRFLALFETTTKNNNVQIVYFDDNDARSFVAEHYPQHLIHFDVLVPGAFKADVLRLLLLHKYGGIYNDISHEYLLPISHVIPNDAELVLCKDWVRTNDWGVYNAFCASIPRHPYIESCMHAVFYNIQHRLYGTYFLDITGPFVWGRAFNLYRGLPQETPIYAGKFNKIMIYYNDADKYGDYKNNFIVDIDGRNIIKCKIENYFSILYGSKNIPHYSTLWYDRKVYNDGASIKVFFRNDKSYCVHG